MTNPHINPTSFNGRYTNEQRLIVAILDTADKDLRDSKKRYDAMCFFSSRWYRHCLDYLDLPPDILPEWLKKRINSGQVAWPPVEAYMSNIYPLTRLDGDYKMMVIMKKGFFVGVAHIAEWRPDMRLLCGKTVPTEWSYTGMDNRIQCHDCVNAYHKITEASRQNG